MVNRLQASLKGEAAVIDDTLAILCSRPEKNLTCCEKIEMRSIHAHLQKMYKVCVNATAQITHLACASRSQPFR